MDEFIHWPKPSCQQQFVMNILLWMIDRMKYHLVSDSNLQHCKSIIPQKNLLFDSKFKQQSKNYECWVNNDSDTPPHLTISIEQDNYKWWH